MTYRFPAALRPGLLAGLLALSPLPVLAEEIVVQHAQGETTVTTEPAKIFTFDLATLDTLEALGVEVDGVPTATLPDYLGKYAGEAYLKIGSLFEPDYEAVAAAAPDLIIVAGRSSAAYPELARIAPTIDLSNDWAAFEDSIKANSQILGEIFGKAAEVEVMIAALDAAIADARAAAAGTGLVVLTNAGEVTAYEVQAATHGDAISFEFILEADPDWLFVIDRDAATGAGGAAEQVLDNELVTQTTAWQQGQVVYLDPIRAYTINGGLPAFTRLVEQVGAALSDR